MTEANYSYTIETEVPPSYFEKLFDFMYSHYLEPQKHRFSNLTKQKTENVFHISYVIIDYQGKRLLHVEVVGSKTVEVTIKPFDKQVSELTLTEARQDVVIATQLFEEKARKAALYFAWREGENIVPEKVKAQEKSFRRILLETQILLFVVFIVLGLGLFVVAFTFAPDWFWIVPITLITVQFVIVFFSNLIIARTGDWTITKENPSIHFLEYHLPDISIDDFKGTLPENLVAIKNGVYAEILSKHGVIGCSEAQKVFSKFNVNCKEENLSAKKVNVYALVKKVADKFGYPMPKIVVSNTMVPNAAASGPSPSRGIVLITTGLLVQLEENEVESVLGHEFGHLKGRDPLILFGLTSAEFLLRFYVLFALIPWLFSSFLFFAYFLAVMTIIFFIGKFFEARADLVSAIIIGKPKVLASALEKIGFQRLLFERKPSFRIQEWIGLDSHPPIYFRVKRLIKLQEPVKVNHPLIQSIKEVFQGFSESF